MKNVILFGFKASGKTYFGKLLALKMGMPFLDTDDLIIHQYQEKSSISEIYQELGEKKFRDLESKVILSLQPKKSSVIALGGGGVLNEISLSHLKKLGRLIYLKSHFTGLHTRILESKKVPSMIDPHHFSESLHSLYEERKPIYESIHADHVDVSLLDEKSILEKLYFLSKEEQRIDHGF